LWETQVSKNEFSEFEPGEERYLRVEKARSSGRITVIAGLTGNPSRSQNHF
jgi:hypothetical protein